MEWWKCANQRKNAGFYVDFDGSAWQLPSKSEAREYSKAANHSEQLIRQLDLIRAIPFQEYRENMARMKDQINKSGERTDS